jgi:hypothetical protein
MARRSSFLTARADDIGGLLPGVVIVTMTTSVVDSTGERKWSGH